MKKRILDILDNTGFSKNFPTPFCNHLQSPASWVHVHPCTDAHRRNDATQLAPNRARASPDSLDSNLHISSFSQLIPGRWMEMVYLEISWNFLKCLEISWNSPMVCLDSRSVNVWTPWRWRFQCYRCYLPGGSPSAAGTVAPGKRWEGLVLLVNEIMEPFPRALWKIIVKITIIIYHNIIFWILNCVRLRNHLPRIQMQHMVPPAPEIWWWMPVHLVFPHFGKDIVGQTKYHKIQHLHGLQMSPVWSPRHTRPKPPMDLLHLHRS